jgi:hypothetical protein
MSVKNNAVVFSLFGYESEHKDCHSFNSFLRFFAVNLRAYSLIYNDWTIRLYIDSMSFNAYEKYFSLLSEKGIVDIVVKKQEELCRSMLWRIEPINEFDVIICRDIDSLPTFKELACVVEWLSSDCMAHAISDSVSHTINLMGGMVGFRKNAFTLTNAGFQGFSFKTKGSDQDFLNKVILPKLPQSKIMEHRFLGYNYCEGKTVNHLLEQLNSLYASNESAKRADRLVNHIGQGGFHMEKCYNVEIDRHYEGALNFYVRQPIDSISASRLNATLLEIEKETPEIFYWT